MVSSRNTPDEWTIPGGGLEPNEDPRDTAAREAMEEVRVVNITSCFRPLPIGYRYGTGSSPLLAHYSVSCVL